jgi:hypothetical protein
MEEAFQLLEGIITARALVGTGQTDGAIQITSFREPEDIVALDQFTLD